jgi:hypothetical protein
VQLEGVRSGSAVTIRTNYHPSWVARTDDGQPLELVNSGGQLGFAAPRDGSYAVTLVYPRRRWLALAALAAAALGAAVLVRWPKKPLVIAQSSNVNV